jgi:hypothetical protein
MCFVYRSFVCRQKRRRVIPDLGTGTLREIVKVSPLTFLEHQICFFFFCLFLLSHCIRSASVFLPLHPEMGTTAKSTNALAFFFNHLRMDPRYSHARLSFHALYFFIIIIFVVGLVLLLLTLPIVVEILWKAPISSCNL